MTYKIKTERQFRFLLNKETRRLFSTAFHPIYCGWRGPGVYSLEETGWEEVQMIWKGELPPEKVKTVQTEFNLKKDKTK